MKKPCILCGYDSTESEMRLGGSVSIDCQNCGKYSLSGTAETIIEQWQSEDIKKLRLLSHKVRKAQGKEGSRLKVISYSLDIIKTENLPTPVEQMDNLILWMGENSLPGENKTLRPDTHQAILGAYDDTGFHFIVSAMIGKRGSSSVLLNGEMTLGSETCATLTIAGWERYERLKKGTVKSRKAFMAMKFGETDLDKIFGEWFRPAVKQTGFDLQTVSGNPVAGLIDEKIRVDIRMARFVVTDLTHENNGAYWEAGFAEGLGKPVIYTCERKVWEEKKTHFDTNHHHTIIWDLDSHQRVAEDLKATIRATLPDEAIMTDPQTEVS